MKPGLRMTAARLRPEVERHVPELLAYLERLLLVPYPDVERLASAVKERAAAQAEHAPRKAPALRLWLLRFATDLAEGEWDYRGARREADLADLAARLPPGSPGAADAAVEHLAFCFSWSCARYSEPLLRRRVRPCAPGGCGRRSSARRPLSFSKMLVLSRRDSLTLGPV